MFVLRPVIAALVFVHSAVDAGVDGQAAIIAIVIALIGAFIFSAGWKKIATLWRRMGASTRIPEIIVALAVLATLTIQGRMILGWWDSMPDPIKARLRESMPEAVEEVEERINSVRREVV